jgi:DNA segregation ATPase FtsK/SpoIIIE-like protein
VLLSLISKLPPSRLELLIIDPKATDFVLYNGLPYLRSGRVITEAEDAIAELQRLTNEELRERTRTLQQARVPNISEFNASNSLTPLKPIVVLIDEYADLMAVLSKKERQEFEREINRLAQRARSVGIHLVLATQRPTADIVTGLLKANMPCRISFRLPSRVDSQTILDQTGAENLLSKGDMLLLMNDRLIRLQGYYMSPVEMSERLSKRFPGSGFAEEPKTEEDELDLSVDDSDKANQEDLVGEVTGLTVGADLDSLDSGDVLTIEVAPKHGEGAEVIGGSGDVLKQSVLAAWRYVQQSARIYGIKAADVDRNGVSVHLVNIAEYREGPSAGIPFVVAMVSALTGRTVRKRIALTGEVSLKGKVGAVGGVPQKIVAAYKRGRRLVIVPEGNISDLQYVPQQVLDNIEVRAVSTAEEAIEAALGH